MNSRNLMPRDCFPKRLTKWKIVGGQQVWRSACGNQLYTWDESHGGEVEVFNKRGRHLGVMNCQREMIKKAVHGRTINV